MFMLNNVGDKGPLC